MPEKPTYEFYTNTYGGKHDEGTFNASLPKAVSKVNYTIWPNEVEDDTLNAYQMAVCAAVDVDAVYGGSGGIGEELSSMSIGSFSASGGSSSDGVSSYETDMRTVIEEHLVGTGLLYMGIA